MRLEDELEQKEKQMLEEDLISIDDLEEFEMQRKSVSHDVDLENKPKGNNNKYPYEFISPQKLNEEEQPLSRVVGHENQKKELLNVIDWFKRSRELKAKGLSTPHGTLLFGPAGCGKSMLIKEIIKCCEAPVFVFKGEKDNAIVEGIVDTFKKARETGHAIVVFDELNLLINKERRVIRALQECMDGVESDDNILVLAATNDLDDIPGPLLRHGRFDKLIHIPYPKGKDALMLFKRYMNEFGVKLPEDFDEEEMELSLNNISCAGIKAIVNDLLLRNGFENITTEMIDKSIFNITDRIKTTPEEDNMDVAIHESSHAVIAKQFPKYFDINRLNISGASGCFHAREVEPGFWPYEKVLADIKICMAGIIGQKIICGRGSRGVESDLQSARKSAYNLLNISGYSTCWETLPTVAAGSRTETQTKRRRMERKIERLLRRCERETYKIVKKNKDKIVSLAKLLFEKKHLKSSEILAVVG